MCKHGKIKTSEVNITLTIESRYLVIDKYQMSNMLLRDKLEFPFTRIKQILSEPDMHLFDGYMFFTI